MATLSPDDQRCAICANFEGAGVHQGCPNPQTKGNQSQACGHATTVHHRYLSRTDAAQVSRILQR